MKENHESKIMPSKTEFLKNLEERFAEAKEVKEVADELTEAGYESYLVGGCLRDLMLGREPKDWDIATNARPEEIQKVFPDSVYENQFGTVLVKPKPQTNADSTQTNAEDVLRSSALSPRKSALNVVEVTTFRSEGKYTDKRHPDEIRFAKTVDEDLSRRDFTINAMAFEVTTNKRRAEGLVDPFGGLEDLRQGVVRTVGNPGERFSEDALRLMRAPRFAVELGFEIEMNTRRAVEKLSGELEMIAKERIRDEFIKIIETRDAARGIILLEELNLLRNVLPELREGLGEEQNHHHIYNVFEHNRRALDYAAKQGYPLYVRLAALLHDIGKPKSRGWQDNPEGKRVLNGKKGDWTFYQHQYIGEKMALRALDRLRLPKDLTEKVALLVREHMFNYEAGVVTEAGVRRLIARVGIENIDDLIKVREADRIGSGVEKAVPYKLRHFRFMVEKVGKDPISVTALKVRGEDVMKILGIEQGPKVGWILWALFDEVLDEPEENTKENLEVKIKQLGKLSDQESEALSEKAKEKVKEAEQEVEAEMKEKYYVK
ncbi:MAG: HD domain-containing protein [Patescibacteria group bacterium]